MKSLPNIFKSNEKKYVLEIEKFINEFPELSSDTDQEQDDQGTLVSEVETVASREVSILKNAEIEANTILAKANKEAEETIVVAKQKIMDIEAEARNVGYESGYEVGTQKGYEEAVVENKLAFDQQCAQFFAELERIVGDLDVKKEQILQAYCGDLRDFAIEVAEKVIHVSLKSSGKIIENMIVAATENSKSKQWVKIYISNVDAKLVLEGDTDLIHSLKHVSDHVKVEIMDNHTAGTCIIELPDQIIDTSVNTQIQNIKELLTNGD